MADTSFVFPKVQLLQTKIRLPAMEDGQRATGATGLTLLGGRATSPKGGTQMPVRTGMVGLRRRVDGKAGMLLPSGKTGTASPKITRTMTGIEAVGGLIGEATRMALRTKATAFNFEAEPKQREETLLPLRLPPGGAKAEEKGKLIKSRMELEAEESRERMVDIAMATDGGTIRESFDEMNVEIFDEM